MKWFFHVTQDTPTIFDCPYPKLTGETNIYLAF